MRRNLFLDAAVVLLLSACARPASTVTDPSMSAAASPSLEVPASMAPSGPTFSEFPADPPIWSLSYDETEKTLNGWFWGYPKPEVRCDGPSFGEPNADGTYSPDPCARSYLRSRGVSDAAIDLLFDRGISVFAVEGTGPVKVVQISDWEEIIVGNGNLEVEADHYYVVTPMGKLETWPPRTDAFEDPGAEPVLQALEDYFRTRPEFSEWGNYAILEMGVGLYLSAPIQTADGWRIDIQSGIRAGCAGCGIPFRQRSALLFAADGTATGYRLVDVCYAPYGSGDQEKDAALAEIGAGLPRCDPLPGR